jgi:succinate-acetate transporter protein
MAVHPQVRVVVQPYGSALPLGFFAFGIGMLLLAALGAGWVKPFEANAIGTLLVTFVFPLEFLAAVIAFLARDTAAASSLALFAGSWLGVGVVSRESVPGSLSEALAWFLVGFTFVAVALAIAAAPGKPVLAGIMSLAAIRALLAAAYEFGAGRGWERAGGWVAFVIFLAAMYGGLALLLEEVHGRAVLPFARRGASKEAVEGDLTQQLRGLEDEPGVRHTL